MPLAHEQHIATLLGGAAGSVELSALILTAASAALELPPVDVEPPPDPARMPASTAFVPPPPVLVLPPPVLVLPPLEPDPPYAHVAPAVHARPPLHVSVELGASPTKPCEKCVTCAAIESPVTVPSMMS